MRMKRFAILMMKILSMLIKHSHPCSDHFLCRFFDGDPQIPFYLEESPSFAVEDIIFDVDENKVCTKQPIVCVKSATFVVDVRSLGHCDDIRADDLGVWDNKGVRTNYFSISFTNSVLLRDRETLEQNHLVSRGVQFIH